MLKVVPDLNDLDINLGHNMKRWHAYEFVKPNIDFTSTNIITVSKTFPIQSVSNDR
jgi:hypothetical protein